MSTICEGTTNRATKRNRPMKIKRLLVRSFGTLFETCMWCYMYKCLLMAILLGIEPPVTTKADHEQSQILKMVLWLGCTARVLGRYAWLSYGFYAFASISHQAVQVLWRKKLRLVESSGLVAFLHDADEENHFVSQRIRNRLTRLVISNLHYQQCWTSFQSSSSIELMLTGRELEDDEKIDAAASKLQAGAPVFGLSRGCRANFNELDAQILHLEHLSRNQSPIRPANRTRLWYRTAAGLWLGFASASMLCCWLVGVAGTSAHSILCLGMIRRQVGVEGAQQRLHFAELLDLIGQHMFTIFTMGWYSIPVGFMATGYCDQYVCLHDISTRMKCFNRRLLKLREFCLTSFPAIEQRRGSICDEDVYSIAYKREIISERSNYIDKVKLAYDSEALELYVMFKSFCDEIRIYFTQAEYSIIMSYCSVFVSAITMIAFASDVPREAQLLYYCILGFVIVTLDIAIYPLGKLTSQCIRTAQLCWPMLACCEAFNEDERNFRDHKFGLEAPKASQQIITQHTLVLWRKLIKDHDLLVQIFSSKLFGLFQISFGTILQLNFALFSLAVLLLTVERRSESQ